MLVGGVRGLLAFLMGARLFFMFLVVTLGFSLLVGVFRLLAIAVVVRNFAAVFGLAGFFGFLNFLREFLIGLGRDRDFLFVFRCWRGLGLVVF